MRGSVNWGLLCPSGAVGPYAWTVFARWRQRGFNNQETGWGGGLYCPCVAPPHHYGLQEFRQQVPQVSRHWQDQAIRPEVCTRYTSFLGSRLVEGWARDGSEGEAQVTHSQSQTGWVVPPQCGPQAVLPCPGSASQASGKISIFWSCRSMSERGRRKPTNLLVPVSTYHFTWPLQGLQESPLCG